MNELDDFLCDIQCEDYYNEEIWEEIILDNE